MVLVDGVVKRLAEDLNQLGGVDNEVDECVVESRCIGVKEPIRIADRDVVRGHDFRELDLRGWSRAVSPSTIASSTCGKKERVGG